MQNKWNVFKKDGEWHVTAPSTLPDVKRASFQTFNKARLYLCVMLMFLPVAQRREGEMGERRAAGLAKAPHARKDRLASDPIRRIETALRTGRGEASTEA